uniref:Vesicular, overexpressed in cancer, prosurvival protein 1 n=1 Tax=Strongyloides papillosus TaxID=174720 RepID=A0A0N5CIC6_STREA
MSFNYRSSSLPTKKNIFFHESGDHHVSEVFSNHDTTYASKATPSIKVVSFQMILQQPKPLPNVDMSLPSFNGWRNLFHKGNTSILSQVSHLRSPRQVDDMKPSQTGTPLAEQSTIMKTVIALICLTNSVNKNMSFDSDNAGWCSSHCFCEQTSTPTTSWSPSEYIMAFILFLWMVKFFSLLFLFIWKRRSGIRDFVVSKKAENTENNGAPIVHLEDAYRDFIEYSQPVVASAPDIGFIQAPPQQQLYYQPPPYSV